MDKSSLHIGAVAFIHRFGSSLNGHVHFHVCVVDGVFEEVAGVVDGDAKASPVGVNFHAATGVDETVVAQVQADLRRRILRAFVGRGLIERLDAKEMLTYQHSGFSVDAGVCIEAHDRAALERLLRYFARPPFAMDRLRKEGAALVPPPRTHRHRYFGVLAPNSPLRSAVTALAAPALQAPAQTGQVGPSGGAPGVAAQGNAIQPQPVPVPVPVPPKRSPAHYLWAVLIARIYEVFPLVCPMCGGQMRLIAFITDGAEVRKILEHIGVESEAPRVSPARGPPLWDDCDAQMGDEVQIEPDWDLAAQPAPDYKVDQRVNW